VTQPGPRSAALLATLVRVPRLVLVLGVVVILLGGAFAPSPFGPALLVVVAALVGWLTSLTWNNSTPGSRLARILVVAAVLAFAVSRF
jgi:uncharacterized membrane protein